MNRVVIVLEKCQMYGITLQNYQIRKSRAGQYQNFDDGMVLI